MPLIPECFSSITLFTNMLMTLWDIYMQENEIYAIKTRKRRGRGLLGLNVNFGEKVGESDRQPCLSRYGNDLLVFILLCDWG
jgi:hypothetical protein